MARSSRGGRGKKNVLHMPGLGDVETRKLVAEGEYLVEVVEVKEEEGDKAPYFSWKFKILDDDKFEDQNLFYNTSLSENSLWNLKSLLEALGADVPDSEDEVDPADFEGMQMMVSVEHDTWQGKKQAKIVDFWEAEEEKEEKEEKGRRGGKDRDKGRGGKDRSKGRGRRGKKDPPTFTADKVNDMDQDELADVIKETDIDVDLDKFKSLRKMQNAVIDALESADLLEKE